jgi:mono/diheme cytochrome c family protein
MLKLKLLICCLWVVAPLLYFSSAYLPAIETSVRAAGGMMIPPNVRANGVQNKTVDFKRDVEPIFKASCLSCHSGEGAQAELRLDSKVTALKGGVSGAAIVPGDSKGSLLMKLVRGEDAGRRMPPGKPLPKEHVDVLARWIDEGANWAASETTAMKGDAPQSAAGGGATGRQPNFVRDIEPIFKASCYGCHAGEKAAGQLRLDARELALKGGISGQVITPGDSEKSRLVHRIRGLHGEARMPLKGEPLSAEQISLVKSWIDTGAEWPENASAKDAKIEKHWAFVAPVRPSVPAVKDAGWIRNPIDNFILARLERENLKPSPEADKATLLRRAKLDLTGLPPTPAEIDSFLADASPEAYEKRVDEFL